MNKRNPVTLRCDCGCSYLVVDDDDEHDFVYLTVYEDRFYKSNGLKAYFKRLWSALRGKEYMLWGMVASHSDFASWLDRLDGLEK